MSAEGTQEERRLDRRGFIGAAAGVVVAAGAATSPRAWAAASAKGAQGCAEVAAAIPKARRGAIHFSFNASAWNTQALFENDWLPLMKLINCNAWEFAGNYPTLRPGITGNTADEGWMLLGSYARAYGFRIVGTHDGPAPTSAANLGSALTKMNAWGCNQLGAGGGYPSGAVNLPNAGTAITNPSAISAWQASAHTMNSWGQAYQTNSGAGVLGITPYGAGVFQGTALTEGRPCARYYRHFHSEQGKWIQNTGTKYDGHYISELIYTETDPTVAYAQPDLCWMLDGLWMAGGDAPSVGIQGPSDPHPGQGKNRLVAPDLFERWQDRMYAFHVKDLGPNDQGTQVRNVGDENNPGSSTYPYGAVPWNESQDTVRFQEMFERLRHPECHEFLFERDGMSNTVTAGNYYKKCYVQAFDMYDKIVLDRDPDTVRTPFPIPSTDAEWAATTWYAQPIDYRPPSGAGAPGPQCPPELSGETRVGKKLKVKDEGTWSRVGNSGKGKKADFCYMWLRDGAPHPSYNGAPIGAKPECSCCGPGKNEYVIQPEDVGHKLSCQITLVNGEDAATSVVTAAVTIA